MNNLFLILIVLIICLSGCTSNNNDIVDDIAIKSYRVGYTRAYIDIMNSNGEFEFKELLNKSTVKFMLETGIYRPDLLEVTNNE